MRYLCFAALTCWVIFLIGCAGTSPPPPAPAPPAPAPPAPAQAKVVNMIPASLSGETNQDSEPFLAVHPTNPQLMSGSAFTPNPNGPASPTAPIFVSQDGGNTWVLCNIVPSQGMTGDITMAFGTGGGNLYAGILRRPGSLLVNELMTTNFTACGIAMTVQGSRTGVDQPFVQATTVAGNDRIYVGNNDLDAPNGRTATVDVSLNGGATYNSIRIETRNTAGQDGPSIRPTVALDGTVYAAYFGWRNFTPNATGGVATSDVVVVRDDNGATGSNPFQDLVGADGLAGRRVVQNVTIPFSNAPTLGQERIGSTLSVSVNPNNSAEVYIAWADRVGTGDIYTLHVRRTTNRGATWSADLRTITNATDVSLAVADSGTVGLLYQQVTGTGASRRWVTHLQQTRNAFATVQDTILATVPANSPAVQFLPYIGDYNFLLAAGNEFRGIFSANNTPDMANFPAGVTYQRMANFTTQTLENGSGGTVPISIDPFYFSTPVMR